MKASKEYHNLFRKQVKYACVKSKKDPLSQLKKYIKATIINLADEEVKKGIRFTSEFWSVSTHKPEINQRSLHRYHQYYEDLDQILENGISSGQFRKNINIETITFILITSLDGIAMDNGIMGIDLPNGTIDVFVDMIMNTIIEN